MAKQIKLLSYTIGNINKTYYLSAVYKSLPTRVLVIASFIDTTLYILADVMMSIHLGQTMRNFECLGKRAALVHLFFTAVCVLVYIGVIFETVITFKKNKEIPWLSRLTSSLLITLEEVPLPICLLIIFSTERRMPLERATMVTAGIKLSALCIGVIKFAKLKFCWFFYPCRGGNTDENIQRCFTCSWYRATMIFVNFCHVLAIVLCVLTLILASTGGIKYAIGNNPCKFL